MQKNPPLRAAEIEVVAPNLKRRLSGVTATVVRLLPVQARGIGIVATGPGLPPELPRIPLWKAATLSRRRWRVWHARRNNEMLLGVILRHVLRRRYRLLFTSAAQRHHSGFTRWLIAKMDAVVATSPKAAGYLERPARVIMHGVDTQLLCPVAERAALRAALGLPDRLLVGCFGRIRHQKGVDVLVDAFVRLKDDLPDMDLVLTGRVTPDNDAYWKAQMDKLRAAGLEERVHFRGEVGWDELVRHFQALDLFVAPARWEGFGLTPLEAMACGVPAVAGRVGAFEDQIVDGETGAIVEAGNVAELARALAALTADREALSRMGRAARAHVEARFRIESEAGALIEVYRELLDGD